MNIITQVFLPLALAFIMFSMGLSLVWNDFKNVFRELKAFLLGSFLQMVVMPAAGFALALMWGLEPALAVGLILLAATPGGVTSNLLTYLARGDTALSISLTAVISMITVFTIPLIVNFSLQFFMGQSSGVELNLLQSTIGIFLITTVPVIIGMVIKAKRETFADQLEPKARKLASVLFVLVIAGAIAKDRANIAMYFEQAGPVTLTLNVLMMALAYWATRLVNLGKAQAIAIAIECGIKNGTLAIFVAASLLNNVAMTIPAAIYSLIMFATAGIFIAILKYRNRQTTGAETESARHTHQPAQHVTSRANVDTTGRNASGSSSSNSDNENRSFQDRTS